MTRWRRIAIRVAVWIAILYALSCVAAVVLSRRFLFPAPTRATSAPAGATTVEANTADGTVARGFRFDAPRSALTVVFFHGNGELAEDNAALARALVGQGYEVVLAEYRGYGVSRAAGAPTEQGIYADAEALLQSLERPRDHIVLMGFSLGTGVAVEMASRGWGRALILLAPYTAIPDIAARWIPFLPMRWLVRDKLDSRSKAAAIDKPVLVAHGDRDEVVPFDMGETVAHTFPRGRFIAVPGGHHTDLFVRDEHLMLKVIDFLIEVTPIE
jgi:pimeloyl-ACP methyl ester carboxylesterase